MPASIGSGAALFDYNRDGLLDVYLIQDAGPESHSTNVLFRQEADGIFTNASVGSGLNVAGYGMGVAVGDINNDGYPDVLVTEYLDVRLFQNTGKGSFVDVTEASGLDNPHWGTSASFIDFDKDGWLDLVIANYVDYAETEKCHDANNRLEFCGPSGFPGTVSKLFRNLGVDPASHQARFQDVTISSGLAQISGPSLGVLCADFNRDRWPDIFFADDGAPNRLWINQHDGTFKEEATIRGLAYNAMGQSQANMGIAFGDVDNDGRFDIFVTHLHSEYHALWKQTPPGLFSDVTSATQLFKSDWRGTAFGTVMMDFDNNGALDITIVNGGIERAKEFDVSLASHLDPFWQPYAQRHQLFANDGRGEFIDISSKNPALSGYASVGRGLACGDIDNDGGMDLLITSIADRVRLLKNVRSGRGHWLMIKAVNPDLGGRDAYGAEIIVLAGGQKFWRLLNPAFSFLCSNDPRIHVGLGEIETVDSIRVLWPDGIEEVFPGGRADRLTTLEKGAGKKVEEEKLETRSGN